MHKFTPLALLFAVLAAACGGSSGDATRSASGADRPESFEDIDFSDLPLSEYMSGFGFGFGDNEDAQAEAVERERQAQQIIAECMINKGFEYQPVVRESITSFGPPGGDIPYFSDAWIERYGFGVTTQRFPQSQVGELVGFPDEQFEISEDFVDPNREYVESLTDGEREAYREAMSGAPIAIRPGEDPPEDFNFEPQGCQGEAYTQAYDEGPRATEFFEQFGDQLQELEERGRSDPRVVEFNAKVAACVAETGEEWIDDQALYERFESRLNEIAPRAFGSVDANPFEAAGVDPEEMSDREMQDFFNEMNRIDPANLAILAELQAEEIALAKTVVECGGGPLNEAFLLKEIRIEYEQQFVDANAEALEAFRDE